MRKTGMKNKNHMTKNNKNIAIIAAGVLTATMVCTSIYVSQSDGDPNSKKEPTTIVQQQTVQPTIKQEKKKKVVECSGTLFADDSEKISIPSGVKIDKVLVKSGDAVSKGDVLAKVDKNSVLDEMEKVEAKIAKLDDELDELKSNPKTEIIKAKNDGVIKKIYAQKSQSVKECISTNGSLITIVLDDDTQETVNVTAEGGTVSEIYVANNEKVSVGTKLLQIKINEESDEYKKIYNQQKKMKNSYKRLVQMSKNCEIVATIDGTVGEVYASDNNVATSGGSTIKTSSTSTSSGNQNARVVKLSTGYGNNVYYSKNERNYVSQEQEPEKTEAVENNQKIELSVINSGNSSKDMIALTQPKVGAKPVTSIIASDGSYKGNVLWFPYHRTFEGGISYVAQVNLDAGKGYVFGGKGVSNAINGRVSGVSISSDAKSMTFKITFPKTQETATTAKKDDKKKSKETKKKTKEKETKKKSDKKKEETTKPKQTVKKPEPTTRVGNQTSGNKSSGSGNTTKPTKKAEETTTEEETSRKTNTSEEPSEEVVVFTLAPNDKMLVLVDIDGADIDLVDKNQEAQVEVDEIEDDVFTGTVLKVDADTKSGDSKYNAWISMEKDERMEEGMEALVSISVGKKED